MPKRSKEDERDLRVRQHRQKKVADKGRDAEVPLEARHDLADFFFDDLRYME